MGKKNTINLKDAVLTGEQDSSRAANQTNKNERSLIVTTGTYLSLAVVLGVINATPVQASLFKGETLDKVADIMSWVVLIIVPVIAIVIFWLVHILPEKIAEKKHHPQAKAIQTLCLLSLFFGGLLWPLAWLWTYTKPVLHQMAYGTDKVVPDHDSEKQSSPQTALVEELDVQRKRVAELERKLAAVKAATK